ncbi:MAG: GMC oxidoreductase [Actinomycetota bacterium]|nr:GMC family oxidoreductase [Actinomycetota bacterium]
MPDVIVIGCGGGGAVVAKELAEAGAEVLVLEAGPWYKDLDAHYTRLQHDMSSLVDGAFRWGPADRTKPPWARRRDGVWLMYQIAGVGGTTQHYNAISVRAYPEAIARSGWPITYDDLVPYYEKVEAFLPVSQVSTLAEKDVLFAEGCEAVGLVRKDSYDVEAECWRPSNNAILPIADMSKGLRWPEADGCTMCGHCIIGCSNPQGAPIERKAKRSTNVSYVPVAVATGRCEIRPESYVTKILTTDGKATGVAWRDSSAELHEASAKVVVLSAGTVESPRLWLNSDLPNSSDAVGRWFTTHLQDVVTGFFDQEVQQDVGQVTMARADFPGYGCLFTQGLEPQSYSITLNGAGRIWAGEDMAGPWDSRGRSWGEKTRPWHDAYSHALSVLVCVDDEEHPDNRVTVDKQFGPDEHGTVPLMVYHETQTSTKRREWLSVKAAEVLRAAGANHIHRTDMDTFVSHPMGTMRMGNDPTSSVVDANCESHEVKGLFIADNSVFANGLGGPNPTLTCQALATRTSDKIRSLYLS